MSVKKLEKAVEEFVKCEDFDEAAENLRKSVISLSEMRVTVAIARQQCKDQDIKDIIETLISL